MALIRTAKLFDVGVVSVTFVVAFAITSGSLTWFSFSEILGMRIKLFNLLFFVSYIALCSATFTSCGLYLSHRLSNWRRHLREILLAVTFITGILFAVRYPFDFDFASDQFLAIFWLLTFAVLTPSRIIAKRLLHYARLRGRNLRSIVIVGEGLDALQLAARIEKETVLGYRVVRVIDAREV